MTKSIKLFTEGITMIKTDYDEKTYNIFGDD